jgi:hypothetical protein
LVEVSDREIVEHPECRCIVDHDLDVPASVPTPPSRHTAASGPSQDRRDLDTDDPAEGPSGGLMNDSTFAASEVDKDVVIGDSDISERSG